MEYPGDIPLFKDILFGHYYVLSEQVVQHERSIFTFLDLIGSLGGVQDIIIFVFAIFISPISEHFFNMKFLRKLYLVRTSMQNIFETLIGRPLKKDNKRLKFKNLKYQIPESIESPNLIKETNIHYPIKLSSKQSLQILFSRLMIQT